MQAAAVGGHLVGHHEVAGRADRGGQSPPPDRVVGPVDDIEHQDDADDGQRDPDQRHGGRTAPVVPQTQPTTRMGAVYSSSNADRQVRDGVVVAELGPGDRGSVHRRRPCGRAQACAASPA